MGGLIYLLDSNIISEPTKLVPNPTVANLLKQHAGHFAISSVTWHELVFGVQRMAHGKRRQSLQFYIEEIIEPDIPILS